MTVNAVVLHTHCSNNQNQAIYFFYNKMIVHLLPNKGQDLIYPRE